MLHLIILCPLLHLIISHYCIWWNHIVAFRYDDDTDIFMHVTLVSHLSKKDFWMHCSILILVFTNFCVFVLISIVLHICTCITFALIYAENLNLLTYRNWCFFGSMKHWNMYHLHTNNQRTRGIYFYFMMWVFFFMCMALILCMISLIV